MDESRSSFETFKSNVCHHVKDMGDLAFIIETLENDTIRELYKKAWYLEFMRFNIVESEVRNLA